jgi:hypothetical protein
MASLTEVLGHSLAIKNALVAGEPVKAWEHSIPLQLSAIELARASGFKSTPAESVIRSQIADSIRECQDLCQASAPLGSDPVGRIGDGKIIKLVLQILMTVAPLFI